MPEITILPVEIIIERNLEFSGSTCDEKRRKAVEGCYSSFCYYDTLELQIASIVVSLVKGHFFIDANKRTGLFAYLMLAKLNGMSHIENTDDQVNLLVEIASSRKDIAEYARLLFPG